MGGGHHYWSVFTMRDAKPHDSESTGVGPRPAKDPAPTPLASQWPSGDLYLTIDASSPHGLTLDSEAVRTLLVR